MEPRRDEIREGVAATGDVFPKVYDELRQLAQARLARLTPGQTLQPTALVHEVYLRLKKRDADATWENEQHFFFAASRAMRDVLVEEARKRASLKRGGGRKRVDTEGLVLASETRPEDLLALDESLERLREEDLRKYQMVLLRFFAGLSAEETARVLDVPLRTLEREWRFVRARLHQELSESD